ncbi:dCMP deaminase family protein [Chryseobacterium salipaludis]|uniref:deoxycytidylate deaminase n=1 Tax=Chryseobacterium TaxID=59732 RepID=UPI001FF53A96|nr:MULTISPECIES: dCMP deaminase family protein [Chryseobacterium]MCJ8497597.1 dCMP deaminase family protein [Chryseobacterium salipaludis]MCX3296005.1 dCMP deaminase family protein [Planobacterium sp. JC490]
MANTTLQPEVTKFDRAYLRMAQVWAQLSHCERRKVGAIIVKDRMIISDGYNGTPSGFENCCEDENGKTLWYVLHAEANAILKLSRSTQSAEGATLYLTLSPCKECSKLILQAGIRKLVYIDEYSDEDGIGFLKNHGIEVLKVTDL